MGDWSYVALAYAAVWCTIVCYAVVLQRRIVRSRTAVEGLRQAVVEEHATVRQEEPACDPVSTP